MKIILSLTISLMILAHFNGLAIITQAVDRVRGIEGIAKQAQIVMQNGGIK